LIETRNRTMLRASREAAAIAAMLLRETADIDECADSELLLPGALMRIEALCNAVWTLQHPRWPTNIAQEFRVVFGKPLEVSHG
jgi:hypothetical protein